MVCLQMLCLAEMINFTRHCEEAIRSHGLQNFHSSLKAQLESYTSVNIDSDENEVQTSAHVLELKLKALVLDTIHNIEIVEQLMESSLKDITDWKWLKHLR